MTSERVQRQVERLLDEAEVASGKDDWASVRALAVRALTFDPENVDAKSFLEAAERGLEASASTRAVPDTPYSATASAPAQPISFAAGRYQVKRFLGEGGKKKVYLAHDTTLDRDVAFAVIKTEGLDDAGRERVTREAQAMGRLGDHPNIVSVFDLGEENGQPYMVLPLLPGGDIEGLIEKAPEHRLPIERVLQVGIEVCQGLEFAHGKGIVHRDLKPGNVWLAEDGRAKIGDFGLAVAVDRSRLTQAGMMVGTVSYMPPEQAMGGEVGPRSDLYSLGCMLYEMVCGRPPFVGDESVAIIGQHLNTPPVAPSWHRPDCPAGLEALILRLLEKDASKRPAAASDVRQALQAVRSEKTPAVQVPIAAPHEHDPLYRRVFIGREHELKQLQASFDAAVSGQGSLAMVVGEPGIGKTSLCEQIATYVAMRGGRALVGHCYEEGSLSLPYLPFVEAMRSYVLARDSDGLRKDLGSGASEVARIVSEVRDRMEVSPSEGGDPEEQRWRLLQAVTGFLRNASAVQPLLIVLEDLHDADRGTLDLLLHLSRNLEGARLLIVGTYRDVEVDRAHPLSAAVAELRRTGSFLRILLRGLSIDEVNRMYTAIRGQEVAWAQAEAVYRQTEGNPLFVQEVLRYIVEEGLVVREGGRYVLAPGTAPGTGIPEGLRDVVGRRLSHLAEKTNQVLSAASVIGRDFRLDVLQRVAGLPEEDLIEALEEATDRAIVEVRSEVGANISYHFTHAFFRQTLYEEVSPPRRIRSHQQVGRALEEVHARRLDEHAAELAEHFSHSSDAEDLRKAVAYAELAAQRSLSVYAYSEAVRLLRQALDVQEVFDPEDKLKRCDLLLALGEAMLPMEQPRRIADTVAAEAFRLADAAGDSVRIARAAVQALEALYKGGGAGREPEFQEWSSRADLHALSGTRDRVYADIYLGLAAIGRGEPAAAHVHLRRAVERALDLKDDQAFFAAAGWALRRLLAIRDLAFIRRIAGEVLDRKHEGVRAADVAICLQFSGLLLFEYGERERAEAAWRDQEHLTERTHDASSLTWTLEASASLAFVDGRLEEAASLLASMQTRLEELGVMGSANERLSLEVTTLNYLGRPYDHLLARIGPGRPPQALKAVTLGLLGRFSEARAISDQFENIGSPEDESSRQILFRLFVLSLLSEDREMASSLLSRLAPLSTLVSYSPNLSIGRLCGAAAKLLGRPDEARGYYMQALEVCEKVRFRPEIALTRLELAELLLEHYPDERPVAIEHLDFAIEEFTAMKMQPSLERALRHRGLLKA